MINNHNLSLFVMNRIPGYFYGCSVDLHDLKLASSNCTTYHSKFLILQYFLYKNLFLNYKILKIPFIRNLAKYLTFLSLYIYMSLHISMFFSFFLRVHAHLKELWKLPKWCKFAILQLNHYYYYSIIIIIFIVCT